MVDLLDDLRARGLLHGRTDEAGLWELLESGPVTLYCRIAPAPTACTSATSWP